MKKIILNVLIGHVDDKVIVLRKRAGLADIGDPEAYPKGTKFFTIPLTELPEKNDTEMYVVEDGSLVVRPRDNDDVDLNILAERKRLKSVVELEYNRIVNEIILSAPTLNGTAQRRESKAGMDAQIAIYNTFQKAVGLNIIESIGDDAIYAIKMAMRYMKFVSYAMDMVAKEIDEETKLTQLAYDFMHMNIIDSPLDEDNLRKLCNLIGLEADQFII